MTLIYVIFCRFSLVKCIWCCFLFLKDRLEHINFDFTSRYYPLTANLCFAKKTTTTKIERSTFDTDYFSESFIFPASLSHRHYRVFVVQLFIDLYIYLSFVVVAGFYCHSNMHDHASFCLSIEYLKKKNVTRSTNALN